jgi:hypothetical protein
MKLALFLGLLALGILSCEPKDTLLDPFAKLQTIKQGNKLQQVFTYEDGVLKSEKSFFVCETNPSEEIAYFYANGKVVGEKIISRLMFSSITAHCDPNLGLRSTNQYEYDDKGRLFRLKGEKSYTEFTYNAQNRVVKVTIFAPEPKVYGEYEYDSKGNLIKAKELDMTTTYTYDDQRNPFFNIRQRPSLITAYNQSPNNVLSSKASNGPDGISHSFDRKITQYNEQGFPVKIEEDGQVYTYVYE